MGLCHVTGAIKTGREGQAYGVGILIRHEIFLLTRTTSSALGSTQPIFQSVTGAFSPGIKQLTTHLHLVLKLGMHNISLALIYAFVAWC